ncbi:MAG TPA: DeoR/GlpR family DNA-binding transcription regulator [Paracoccaceae bacterium]|nr:DeoR/GlpR family DNA-binding transcription regulator [Paracoccaceae bacterium]
MKPSRNTAARRIAILKHLQVNGRALVDELADMFQTTPQTVRKDLSALEKSDQITRFHGGAALLIGTEYTGFSARQEIARDEKEAIGRQVASLIPNNSSLILNAGTTTAAAARFLLHHVGIKVVTDSVSLANEIKGFAGIEVLVPGGSVRKSDGAILGEAAVDFIRQFRVDTAVIGAAAIAPDGALLDFDLREASVVRAIIENARTVILAADSMKFGRAAPICIGELGNLDVVVTDRGCPKSLKELCAQKGVRLILAG